MLTYEALIEQARLRGMPTTKMRGVLREYLQVLILKELCKLGGWKKLYFTGGTYLRLTHDLKRFSEDLDFNTEDLGEKKFEEVIHKVRIELKRVNLDFQIRFRHWENIVAAHLAFPTVEEAYHVVSRYSKQAGVVIKIETNKPKWKIKKETQVISGFGEIYPCVCTDRGALFADKIDALTKKTRARHLFDIIFMLSNYFPIDRSALKILGIHENPLNVIAERIKSFSKAELKKQAESLRPFLFEESEADLVANAHVVIPALLEKYRQASS